MNLNLLKTIAAVSAVVLISPVILIYGVPFAFGIVSDIVQLGYGPIAALLFVSAVGLRRSYRAAVSVAA